MRNRFCMLLVLVLVFGLAAFSQNTGRISGTVVDASGAAVPNAKVDLSMAGSTTPLATVQTNQEGRYFFTGLQPVTYDVTIELTGFDKEVIKGLKVDAGVEAPVRLVTLGVKGQVEVVEVSAQSQTVQTNNAEVTTNISRQQLRDLPTLNRSPLALLQTQAGVSSNSRTNTTINGLRPSYTNITLDGINIQDNFIRTNALDFQPSMLQIDQIGEMTLSTSNSNTAFGNGAAQVTFTTPSGTNQYHGSAIWYNRNNAFASNTWFNNKNGVAQPFLNQNQFGGSVGGPIVKDKLFFYANYEGTRLIQQASATRTIFREDARNGIFTYRDTANVVRTANIYQLTGLTQDPKMAATLANIPGANMINRNDIGDGLNTGGYSFNIRDNRYRDNVTGKLDWYLTSKNSLSFTYIWNRDLDDRPDLSNDYATVPKAQVNNNINLGSVTWRYSPTGAFTNEFRGGMNLAPGVFGTNEDFGSAIINTPLVGNPINTFMPQGRYTNTYNIQDNATWFKGKHTMAFGFQGQQIAVYSYTGFTVIPTYNLGFSANNPNGITQAMLPGVRSQDVTTANSLLAFQAGQLTNGSQEFNVTSQTSGYVPGAPNARRFRQYNTALYFNDSWRVSSQLTLNLGVRWEFFDPVNEVNSLALLPILKDNNTIATMLSNSVLDWAGKSVGRPWYNSDFNNFAPNVGLAWQPFKNKGRTVIRGAYSINYPNDEFIRSIDNNVGTNAGLNTTPQLVNLNTRVSAGLPTVTAPPFKVPLSFSDTYATNTSAAFGMPEPNLVTPYVQQWNIGVQQEFWQGVLEVRYVGNHATKAWRGFDYNQVNPAAAGFLDDFKRARNNGFLAQRATGSFNPNYNASIAGSQPLTVFPLLPNGGNLGNATVLGHLQQAQAGELANFYQTSRANGPISFYANRYALGANVITNYSNQTYNGLQIDYSRRFAQGFFFQTNYTYSKVLSDAAGDGQTRFDPFLDINNAAIERSITPFNLAHAFKFNGFYEIPVGKGKKVNITNRWLDLLVGGWNVSGLMTWQSGAPFSVLSARGTLNRTARSAQNTVNSNIDGVTLQNLAMSFYMTGNGPYMAYSKIIGPDGRAVSSDGSAPFAGQVFANPEPGGLGALQRRYLTGPQFWNLDGSIGKRFTTFEKQYLEFRAETFNATNTPSFFIGDQNVNSATFGRITSTSSGRRVWQFGLRYIF